MQGFYATYNVNLRKNLSFFYLRLAQGELIEQHDSKKKTPVFADSDFEDMP